MKLLNIIFYLFLLSCPKTQGFAKDYKKHAKEFKNLLKQYESSCGVYLYNRSIEKFDKDPNTLISNISSFGITDIYLSVSFKKISSSSKYKKLIQEILILSHKRKISVYAILLDHKVLYDFDRITKKINLFTNYQKASSKNQQFDGIHTDIEPHILKKGRDWIPKEFPFRWDKKKYGIGKDNDELMKLVLKSLRVSKKLLGKKIHLSQAIPHFFHHHAKDRDLSVGTTNDFLKICDELIIMAYSSKAKKVISYCKDELNNSPKRSITIAVKTSIKTKGGGGDSTSFYKHGWGNMLISLREILEVAHKKESFKGLAIFEWEGFLAMTKI